MAKPFRLYVCSDLHASERSWRKFVNAMRANVYGVDAAVIAGDLTGKALIAVVKGEHGGEAWTASILGQRRVARDEQELLGLERSIADLGYYAVRVTETERAAMEADPDLVRSYFHDQIAKRVREWMTLAAERLDGSGVPVYLMPGNDDEFEIDAILAESMYCRNVNEQVVELTPWHQLVSMGWSSPTPWSTPRELPEEEFLDRLSGLLQGVRDPRRTVIMTHVPPYDSGLDTAPLLSPDLRPPPPPPPAPEPPPAGRSGRPASAGRSSGSGRSSASTATSTSRAASGGSVTRAAGKPGRGGRWGSPA